MVTDRGLDGKSSCLDLDRDFGFFVSGDDLLRFKEEKAGPSFSR